MSERRVVVTGLGATTPLGGTIAETWDGILAGRSGAKPLPEEWLERYELPVHFACTIAQKPEEVLTKVEVRRMDPSAQYAVIASRAAMEDAGSPEIDPLRLGVAIGTGIGGVWTLLDQWDILKEKGVRRVFPLAVPMLMPNTSAGNVSLQLGARAGAHTTVSACASGAESMGTGYDMIRGGRADIVVAGGTEAAIHPLPFAGFAQMQALSTRNDDIAAASRPYDTGRDGFVMGEGAAVMVLEEYEHAVARGARIYAEFASIGMSADAHHITAPEPEGAGASRAMREAVERAGLTDKDIIHINAHATSTPVGDVAEAERDPPGVRCGRRRHVRQRDEVDDRSPARCGGCPRGPAHRALGPPPRRTRRHQHRRLRPQDRPRRRARRAPHAARRRHRGAQQLLRLRRSQRGPGGEERLSPTTP